MTPPADLRAIGEALYGERWMTELSVALGVSDRTVRRWAAEQVSLPPGVVADLAKLCAARGGRLLEIAKSISG